MLGVQLGETNSPKLELLGLGDVKTMCVMGKNTQASFDKKSAAEYKLRTGQSFRVSRAMATVA